eukprot:g5210.t1
MTEAANVPTDWRDQLIARRNEEVDQYFQPRTKHVFEPPTPTLFKCKHGHFAKCRLCGPFAWNDKEALSRLFMKTSQRDVSGKKLKRPRDIYDKTYTVLPYTKGLRCPSKHKLEEEEVEDQQQHTCSICLRECIGRTLYLCKLCGPWYSCKQCHDRTDKLCKDWLALEATAREEELGAGKKKDALALFKKGFELARKVGANFGGLDNRVGTNLALGTTTSETDFSRPLGNGGHPFIAGTAGSADSPSTFGAGQHGGIKEPDSFVGRRVDVTFSNGLIYGGYIQHVGMDGTYHIVYDDGDEEWLELPNEAVQVY